MGTFREAQAISIKAPCRPTVGIIFSGTALVTWPRVKEREFVVRSLEIDAVKLVCANDAGPGGSNLPVGERELEPTANEITITSRFRS